MNSLVRTRMAPSPTGNLHLGTAYATIWPFLFAKKNNGKFILRFEDTDFERSKKEFEKNILDGLKWLGLKWDEGPYHQTDRLNSYQKAAQKLLEEGKAYYCFCSTEQLAEERKAQREKGLPQVYSGKCRDILKEETQKKISRGSDAVIRFIMPDDRKKIVFKDLLHGEVSFDAKLIGDTIIVRSNGVPLYNFAVVVDDIDMGITHVIRGDDHISNTPKQVVLFESLGANLPQFIHYPMVLNQDRVGKLSKRTGSTSVDDYKKEGYLNEAIINYLVLLGWTPPDDKEILSVGEITKLFDIKDMNPSAAAWNPQKLDWINGEYIRKLKDERLTQKLQEYLVDHPAKDKIASIVPLIKERIKKLSDFIPLTHFFFEEPEYDISLFEKLKIKNQKEVLEKVLIKLEDLKKSWNKEDFESSFRDLAQELNISSGDMFQIIRVAISGQLVTPPLFESIKILGEQKTLDRIKKVSIKYPDL